MNKKELTETDIRSKFITPAIVGTDVPKWDLMTQVLEERYFTKGRVDARGKMVARGERLVTKGLVRRGAASGDKRFQSVLLSAAGAKLVPVLAGLADQNDNEFFSHLTANQRADLMATLQEIARRRGLNVAPVD